MPTGGEPGVEASPIGETVDDDDDNGEVADSASLSLVRAADRGLSSSRLPVDAFARIIKDKINNHIEYNLQGTDEIGRDEDDDR